MSTLRDQVSNDMKTAMKAKETAKRDALRLLLSAFKQIEVDERKELTDEDVSKIIQKQVKQRQDSAAQFKEAGRDDLLEKEEAEIAFFMVYMGKVMGVASKTLAGKADGKRINECVKKILA